MAVTGHKYSATTHFYVSVSLCGEPVLMKWRVKLYWVNTCVITWLSLSSRCLWTLRTGLLPLTDLLSCNLVIYFSYTLWTSSVFTLRYGWRLGWDVWSPTSRTTALYIIFPANYIWFTFNQTRCDLLYLRWALTRFMEQNLQLWGRELWAQSVFLTHFIQINPAWHQTAWHQTIMTCMDFQRLTDAHHLLSQ